MKKFIVSAAAILCVLACSAFLFASGAKDGAKNKAQNDKPSVVATIFPVYDFARAVMYGAGDAQTGKTSVIVNEKNLKLLVKPGMEIHSFDPSPADIAAIHNADVFIYIGGESDEWVEDVLKSIDTSDKTIVRLMDYVDLVDEEIVEGMEAEDEHDHEHDHAAGEAHDEHDHEENEHEADEHIWTSPANAVKMVDAIRDALVKIDTQKYGGKNAAAFTQNAAAYNAQIRAVDAQIRKAIDSASDKFILMGDRFPLRYFTDYYGLGYSAAFNGCSTAVEASTATIAYLIDKAAEKKVPAVFAIELSNQKIAKTVAEGAAKKGAGSVQVLELHTIHNVSRDDFKAGETWVSLMKRNAESLKKGLR